MGTPDHNKRLPLAFASYEPHHGRSTDGQTVRSKDTTKAPGTSRVTPAGDSKLRNARPAASHIINQALMPPARNACILPDIARVLGRVF